MMLVIAVITFLIIWKVYLKLTDGFCTTKVRLEGKIALVTGGTSGIGLETARDLARRGARVIIASFDEKQGLQAVDNIISDTGNKNIAFKYVDLRSFQSIRDFVKDIKDSETRLHILVNNAGMYPNGEMTKEGWNSTMQVNYFSHVLLTYLLLPLLKASAPSRIVNVTSLLFLFGTTTLEYKDKLNALQSIQTYSNSKLCEYLFTIQLAKKLKDSGVTVNAGHPGSVQTNLFDADPYLLTRLWNSMVVKLYGKTPMEGAQTSIYLAVDPEIEEVTGRHFGNCQETYWVNPLMNYEKMAEKLLEDTKSIVKLTKDEILLAES